VPFEPFWGRYPAGKRPRFLQTRAPRPLRGKASTMTYPFDCDGGMAARRRGTWKPRRTAYDVSQTGSGTAHSRVVTRCNSALTGQELGKWRRIRSLYCLICAAILKRIFGLDHGVGHFRPFGIPQQRYWLAYPFIAMRHEGLCQVF